MLLAGNAGVNKLVTYQARFSEGHRSSEDPEEQLYFRLCSQLMDKLRAPPHSPPPTSTPSFKDLPLPARELSAPKRKLTLVPPKLMNCSKFADFKLKSHLVSLVESEKAR